MNDFFASGSIASSTLTTMSIETSVNEGITGFNTSLSLDDSGRPYISYINNSELNSTSGLHLARFTGTVSVANLTNPVNKTEQLLFLLRIKGHGLMLFSLPCE